MAVAGGYCVTMTMASTMAYVCVILMYGGNDINNGVAYVVVMAYFWRPMAVVCFVYYYYFSFYLWQ